MNKALNYLTGVLLFCSLSYQAVIADEFDDLESFFSIRQKSTLDDFPLQEIGGEALSDAAIEGALQVNTASGNQAKPIYLEEKEHSDKEKSGEALKEGEQLSTDSALEIKQFRVIEPHFQLPVYQQPSGRTYNEHHSTTVERP